MAAPTALKSSEFALKSILDIFPKRFSFAFAYGSGVLDQDGRDRVARDNAMVDLVVAVDNPMAWHAANLKLNRGHYSLLRWAGPGFVSALQRDFAAGVYYNTLVQVQDIIIKYGVISTSQLVSDLLDWDTLYISGRLQKPVRILASPQNSQITSALQINLHSALHSALLTLPETFHERELFLQIAGISYLGDFRMLFGEDRNKVSNIVLPQIDRFRDLYCRHMRSMSHILYWDESRQTLEQDCSSSARLHHLNLLPKQLQRRLLVAWNRDGPQDDVEDVLRAIALDVDCPLLIMQGIEDIVRKSSWKQSLKGILTAGLWKSVRYGAAKLKKMITSMKQRKKIQLSSSNAP